MRIKSKTIDAYELFNGMSYKELASIKDIFKGNRITIEYDDKKHLTVFEILFHNKIVEKLFYCNFCEIKYKEITCQLLEEYLKYETTYVPIQYGSDNLEHEFLIETFKKYGYTEDLSYCDKVFFVKK